MASDIWCLGALIIRIFTNKTVLEDNTLGALLDQAKLDGAIPSAWREYWDTAPLRERSDQIMPENADVEWTQRRDGFMQKNPDFDAAEVDLLIPLLRRMVAGDPDACPSADEVIAHPWFVDGRLEQAPNHDTSATAQDEHASSLKQTA
ncbi:hypothetical protein C8T65DRAFT_139027 [Cerioporus squamosus]|nr:hypothetical protein C8T65DRAFT_139027 [Cerioporus squamosus]